MRIKLLLVGLSLSLFAGDVILPITNKVDYDKQKAQIGQELFFDPILSKDKTISCASCHKPSHGWADDTKVSYGVGGAKGKINSPTVLNAVYNFKQLWNGGAKDLKDQVKGPIHNQHEMNMSNEQVEKRLNNNSRYKEEFKEVYHTDHISYDNVLDAISEFEKTLITPNSKFDKYLKGEVELTEDEKKGSVLFKSLGCVTCHNGTNIGGNSFQKIGIVIEYKNCFKDKYEITKREFDRCVYKVPTLRNIELTSPYFHDGSAKTLEGAIKKMSYHNLGFEIEDDKVKYIKAFLKTLTGEITIGDNYDEK